MSSNHQHADQQRVAPPSATNDAFNRAVRDFHKRSPQEISRFFREIGAWSEDGRLTTLYGGDAEPDHEAMEAHRLRQEEAFRKLRGI